DAALAGGHEANVCFRLGKILFLLGDYPAARERFYSALELDRGYVDAKFGLGKTFAALGELEEARLAFLDAISEKQDDPALRVELGKLYLRLNRKEDAELEFRRAIDGVDDPKLADDIRRLLLALAVRN
ncbi:MAG: tetratricopeptide repeat protein, partial [Thermoguttaceae bacterium]|nr:tetratricopeptide repeat protein [Thermoguttaceae bacterium]